MSETIEFRGKFIRALQRGNKALLKKFGNETVDDAKRQLKLLLEAKKPDDLKNCSDWKELGSSWKNCFQTRIVSAKGTVRMRYKWIED